MRPDPLGRLQRFPSQLVHDGRSPMVLQPDREESDPEDEEVGNEGAEGGEEHLAGAEAGCKNMCCPHVWFW